MSLRCRLGLHKKRLRQGEESIRTFLAVGVNLWECEREGCDWRMKGIRESGNR